MISAAGAKGDKLGVGAEMRLEGLGCTTSCATSGLRKESGG